MNCAYLRVGDEVAIRMKRWHDQPVYQFARISDVYRFDVRTECGRQFGTKDGREDVAIHQADADLVAVTDEIRRVARPPAPAVKPAEHRKRLEVDA